MPEKRLTREMDELFSEDHRHQTGRVNLIQLFKIIKDSLTSGKIGKLQNNNQCKTVNNQVTSSSKDWSIGNGF